MRDELDRIGAQPTGKAEPDQPRQWQQRQHEQPGFGPYDHARRWIS